jgi:drug/metabolite transporter (DMT)-like permease
VQIPAVIPTASSVATESAGLPLFATLAVLAAAVAHAGWNAIAAGIGDKLVSFTLLGVIGTGLALPLTVLAPVPDPRSWPYLAASAAVHVAYNVLLMLSYRVGDFGQVYPLARGTSPLVVTVLAAVFVGERLTPPQVLGVVVVSTGLASLVFAGSRQRRPEWIAVTAAVATGLAIATYTVIDGVGVRLSGSALGYVAWLTVLHGPVIPFFALARRGRRVMAEASRFWRAGLAGGVLTLLAYGLVLWAQTQGALAPIAALRETSVIVGAIIGAIWFHERFGRQRIVAATLVTLGIVVLEIP